MRRTVLMAWMALGLLALAAGSAEAKGRPVPINGRAIIRGPGLLRPVALRGDSLKSLLELAHPPVPVLLCCYGYAAIAPPSKPLGPRYVIRYELHTVLGGGARVEVSFLQYLYPYAPDPVLHEPDPWLYTPPQEVTISGHSYRVRPGWLSSFLLFDILTANGLPRHPPAGSGSAKVLPFVVLVLGTLAILAIVLLHRSATRRSRERKA